jgi:dTDP-4-dehydrorhamnose 3,5-epimerase-like enzyme
MVEFLESYFVHKDSRGQLTGIINDRTWEELNHITSDKNMLRGNHYHRHSQELFFIITGRIKVNLVDVNSNEHKEFYVKSGDIFIIHPFVAHVFEVLESSSWINAMSKRMSNESLDIHRYIIK